MSASQSLEVPAWRNVGGWGLGQDVFVCMRGMSEEHVEEKEKEGEEYVRGRR